MSRSHTSLFIASLLTLSHFAPPASAACHTQAIIQNNDEIAVAVPFAVPVGVPVAPLAPYFYGYQQIYSPMPQPNGQAPRSNPTQQFVPANDATSADPSKSNHSQSTPPSPPSLVATTCAKCHGGQAPKAGLSLEHPEALSTSDRLRAIHVVATGRMPKGKPLSPKDAQAVIAELATISEQSQESSPEAIDTTSDK